MGGWGGRRGKPEVYASVGGINMPWPLGILMTREERGIKFSSGILRRGGIPFNRRKNAFRWILLYSSIFTQFKRKNVFTSFLFKEMSVMMNTDIWNSDSRTEFVIFLGGKQNSKYFSWVSPLIKRLCWEWVGLEKVLGDVFWRWENSLGKVSYDIFG